ncbi:hypothetical protein BGX23_008108, partial [Mortierella sp. AD031]
LPLDFVRYFWYGLWERKVDKGTLADLLLWGMMDEQIAAFHAYRIDEEKKPMNKKQKIQSTIGYIMKK